MTRIIDFYFDFPSPYAYLAAVLGEHAVVGRQLDDREAGWVVGKQHAPHPAWIRKKRARGSPGDTLAVWQTEME